MGRMGDVLAGIHATWEFEPDAVLIRFERGIRAPRLYQVLRERRVPYEALASVAVSPGRRGTVVLHAVPRPGADPLMDAAAGQLPEGVDPYRLVLPQEQEKFADYYADELRGRIEDARISGPGADVEGDCGRAERFLITAPTPPLQFKAYDGKAVFDGEQVAFRWSRTGASSAKWKAGDQFFPVSELAGVEWRSPELIDGHLRLVRRGAGPQDGEQAEKDPAAVVFGAGYGPVHESLPFAAAVLAAVRKAAPVAVPAGVPSGVAVAGRDPAAVAERIRHLGELYQAGLVTDEEFAAKKAQLLDEL
ncbi:hypothetical protein C6N75_03135 [Streptomyces solincola]|uniref:DUF4429 domain-containing protein n=1 Tax=Streptomyces solincola TaxID=2100817 RepID=A0A2S9Q1Y1_9ACTN|nr:MULTISPECIES: DUF4429 domain-containing protein [Streptomyces]PRH80627.1 hypothetical protein C6N75_03135 [Streptomyces solincola]